MSFADKKKIRLSIDTNVSDNNLRVISDCSRVIPGTPGILIREIEVYDVITKEVYVITPDCNTCTVRDGNRIQFIDSMSISTPVSKIISLLN